jgi:predicted protein tyrosine phosphatase
MPYQKTFTTGARLKRFLNDPQAFGGDVYCYDIALVVNSRILSENDDLHAIADDATVEIRRGTMANADWACVAGSPPAHVDDGLAAWFRLWLRSQPEACVQVMSRAEAEQHRPLPGAVCISIANPRQSPARLEEGWSAVLRLGFHDTDRPGGNFTPMTQEHAREVIAFCHSHRDAPIVVHCQVGHSRSVAVGAFIAAWLDRKLQLNTDVLNPNPWAIRELRRLALKLGLTFGRQHHDWRLLAVALRGPLAPRYRYQMLPAAIADSYR